MTSRELNEAFYYVFGKGITHVIRFFKIHCRNIVGIKIIVILLVSLLV